MQSGKIKTLNERRFGFIDVEGQEDDLFFHSSELKNVEFEGLQEGDTVTFEVAEGQQGKMNAVNVNKA